MWNSRSPKILVCALTCGLFSARGLLSWTEAGYRFRAADLAIEVISPSEHTAESMAKVDSYFRAGALEVWQVYPKPQQVFVYVSAREIRKLSAGDSISTALLPGFELPVAAIFAR
jgi:Uma2 family endonuclease